MVKLTISLPNSTQITLESDDFDAINRVLSMILHGAGSVAASFTAPDVTITNGRGDSVEKSKDASSDHMPNPAQPNGSAHSQSPDRTPPEAMRMHLPTEPATNGASNAPLPSSNDPDDDGLFLEAFSAAARDDFVAFCQNLNPMGDMRRVVVAAEGACRFFRADGVTSDEWGELFDLAGWRRANSFTQTLRNAARSKFGWLERIPGRAGRYAATDHGRTVTMGG